MQNEIMQKPETPISRVAFAPGIEPTVRLEPLAVPLGRLGSILRRHLWAILLTFLLGVGATIAVVAQMPKSYTAEASILIEPQRTQVSDLQAITPDPGDVSSLLRTQIDILRAPALSISVVKALHLTENPEFALGGGGLRAKAKALMARIGLLPETPEPVPTPEDAVEAAATILGTKLGFANEFRSSVLKVTVTTKSAELSASIANEMARQFLDFKRQGKFAAMQRAHDWFQEQMGTLSNQLRAAELDIERYRQQHRLDEQAADENGTSQTATVNRQQLDAISRQLVDVSRERARKEGLLVQAQAVLRGEAPGGTLPAVLASPVITQLLAQTATVAGREAQLASSQGARNPELMAVRAQLHKLQLHTEQEMSNVANSLKSEVKAAVAQEHLLQQQMERLRGAVGEENSAQSGLQALQTKARATRSIYESFLNRATQLANVSGIQEPDASLVSSARPPLDPSAPQTVRLLGVAALLSLVVGVVLACVIERLRTGFSQPEQLEGTLGLPVVAMLPAVPRSTLRGRTMGRAGIAFTASLDKLRGQLRALGERRPSVVMVTSALPQEGKSVFAAGVARNAAAAGWRVILIECDFGCPSLAGRFNLPLGPGLCEILSGNLLGDSSSAIHEPEPRLHVVVAGRTRGDPQELLASNRMSEMLADLRTRYDLIVLDTPPVLPVADALVLARQADATLMVVRWEKTASAAAQDALRLLRESHACIMGAVMTRIHMRTAVKAGGRLSHAFHRYDSYHVARASRT